MACAGQTGTFYQPNLVLTWYLEFGTWNSNLVLGIPNLVLGIPTKLGTEIRLNEPFKCAKFQPDWSTNSCFMANFAKCAKRRSIEEEKNEEKKPKLWPLVSQKWMERFSSNVECGLPYLAGTSVATLVSIG